MVTELLVKDEVIDLPRVDTEVIDEGNTLGTIVIGSNWINDNQALDKAIPQMIPEGLMFRPERRNVEIVRGGQIHNVEKVFMVPVLPAAKAPVKKAGVNLDGMTDMQLRSFAAENSIKLPPETKTNATPRALVIDTIRKGLAK